MDKKSITILIVDDEPEILSMITDFLTDVEGYTVLNARNGQEALDSVLPHYKIDLILSDINMPIMKGFELLARVRKEYPSMKRVLITAYNVEDYIELALKHDVGNIFVKSTPFNFTELSALLENLLSGDIFGIKRYFSDDSTEFSLLIKRGDQIDQDADRIISHLPKRAFRKKLNLVLIELLTNAIFYGIRKEKPEAKEGWVYEFDLEDHDAISVSVMYDETKYAISITDKGGHLKKMDVLYWLHRQVARDESGIPLGVFDTHGRGFFIARKYIDRLIINIHEGKQTEVIILNYYDPVYQGSKPIHINEI